jgi:pimeloyl-ACP methyl ester carboxylesterase
MPWRESAAEIERARAEQPVVVASERGALFGVFTPPAPAVAPRGRCVVFFTRPRSHRNRMYVEGARRLASRGFACFRFDYHGTGDSSGESHYLDPNQPYRDDAVAVLRFLRERQGQRRFVLAGSCFDARTALSAFVDEGAAIDGLVFAAAPLMELDTLVKADAERKDWRHLLRALTRSGNWRALATPGRWRYMATVTSRVARSAVAGRDQGLLLSASFLEHFEALCRSRARVLFLYGEADAEYPSFQLALELLFPALDPAVRARFEIEIRPGLVHDGYHEMNRQREVVERTLAWIEALPGAPQAEANGRAAGAREAAWISG